MGGYIHAVPKVTRRVAEDNGEVWFEVAFEEYGSHRTSHIKGTQYCGRGSRENINDYCTGLDSSAENLISQLDGIQGGGTVTEPYDNYLTNEERPMQSLRAENANVRIDENNGIIMTYKPINAIEKVLCRYIPGLGARGARLVAEQNFPNAAGGKTAEIIYRTVFRSNIQYLSVRYQGGRGRRQNAKNFFATRRKPHRER